MEDQKEEKKLLKGELTEAELKVIVTQYPGSSAAIFENGDGENVCIYLKKVERETFVAGNKIYSTKDEITTTEYLLQNLWIAGYPKADVIKDFEALKNCSATILPVLWVKAGELKKN